MQYLLCQCEAVPGGNRTDPSVESLFRSGFYRQVWNNHATLTSLVVAKAEDASPPMCCTPLANRQAALNWLTSVDAGAPVTYRDLATGFDRTTARTPVDRILAAHEEGI